MKTEILDYTEYWCSEQVAKNEDWDTSLHSIDAVNKYSQESRILRY
jgi:hypothetical protein